MQASYPLEKAGKPHTHPESQQSFNLSAPVVKTKSLNRPPSRGLRVVALLAAGLVMGLVVFSASPELHAWLHSHEGVAASQHPESQRQSHQMPGQDDDGCIVTLFACGLISLAVGVVIIAAVCQFVDFVVQAGAAVNRPAPRYCLPPLCRPSLS